MANSSSALVILVNNKDLSYEIEYKVANIYLYLNYKK